MDLADDYIPAWVAAWAVCYCNLAGVRAMLDGQHRRPDQEDHCLEVTVN